MRAITSLAVVALLGSCSALDNFGKFTVGTSVDMAGGGCTPGCDCIAAVAALGVPEHCRVAPLNGWSCAGGAARSTITLAPGTYQLQSAAVPPVLSDANSNVVATGVQSGGTALFCVGSLVGDAGVHVIVVGAQPVAIVADSMIRLSGGSWTLAGSYAIDRNGAPGSAGGTAGGTNGNSGVGGGGGKGGSGAPGTGGGGGGAASQGAGGGASAGGSTTPGGAGSTMPVGGFGGGAGGSASSFGGGGGGGAGALQMSASWAVVLSSVIFDASGGGGAGGGATTASMGAAGGGGGGGGGGVVVFDAPDVSITGGCVSVIGGPGGAGGALTRGGDAHPSAGCGFIGTSGVAPANGGGGGTPGTGSAANAVGGTGTGIGGGGGGIGGAGRVVVRSHNPPPQSTPPGVIPMTAYAALTLP